MKLFEFAQGTFTVVLEATVSAAVLVVMIGIVQFLLRNRLSPAWRFALWTPVLLRLLIPILPESSLSLFNAPRWLASFRAPNPVIAQPFDFSASDAPIEIATGDPLIVPFPQFSDADQLAVRAKIDFRSAATAIWITGALLLLSRLVFGSFWLTLRLRRETRNVPSQLREILDRCLRELGARTKPRLVQTNLVESPALFGLFRPTLLLPAAFAERLNQNQIRHVFLHELAHLKRRDLYLNWLMALAQAVHWFNPFVWLAFRRMRLERELACDEMVLRASATGDPKAYGQTILQLLEGVSAKPALAALVGIAEEKHSACARLQQIAAFKSGHRRYWLALPVLLCVTIIGLTNAQAPKPVDPTPQNTPATSDGEPPQSLLEKLTQTRISELDLEGRTVTEAIKLLQAKLPADLQNLEFHWHQYTNITSVPGVYSVNAVGYINTRIGAQPTPADQLRLSLKYLNDSRIARMHGAATQVANVPVTHVLDLITSSTEKTLFYTVEGNHITLFENQKSAPNSSADRSSLFNDGRLLFEMGKLEEAEEKFKEVLKADPDHRPANYYLIQVKEQRFNREVRNREDARLNSRDIDRPNTASPPPNPFAQTNRVYASARRQTIIRKLEAIVLDIYEVDNLELSEVIKDLDQIARSRDADKIGVNFLITSLVGTGSAAPSSPSTKLENYKVTIQPPLRNVRLIDILDAIVRVAAPPETADQSIGLKYNIEDYGVVFSHRVREAEQLYTRTFRVDPNTFLNGLDGVFAHPIQNPQPARVIGVTVTNSSSLLQEKIRNFFTAAGIDFATNQLTRTSPTQPISPQKAIFFNERTGILFVRATLRDLDIIESALQALNVAPPQVLLRTRALYLKTADDLTAIEKILVNLLGKPRPALTEREFRQLLKDLEKDGRFLLTDLPTVSTAPGRPARTNLEPGDGYVIVDATPHYRERDSSFIISASAHKSEAPAKKTMGYGILYDGQTFVLLPKTENGNLQGEHIIFITPELIDPAGNRVFTPDNPPFDTEKTPPQSIK